MCWPPSRLMNENFLYLSLNPSWQPYIELSSQSLDRLVSLIMLDRCYNNNQINVEYEDDI